MPTNRNTNFEEEWFNTNELIHSNINILQSTNESNERQLEILNTIQNTLILTNDSFKTITNVSPILNTLLESLRDLLSYKHIDLQIRFTIVGLLITFHEKNLLKLQNDSYVIVICFLIENCSVNYTDKKVVPFVKKLRKLLSSIQNEELRSIFLKQKSRIISSLQILMKEIRFCVSEKGREIVSYLVCIGEEIFKEFHLCVKKLLVSCKKTDAYIFGKMYYRIWELISDDDKKHFEEEYIQWLMERAFTIGRLEPLVRNLSLNLQSLLFGLHCCRKQAKFSKLITALYTPLIWKYLSSNNNIHRANATEIFMHVYPLERPGEGKKSYSRFIRKQHEEMITLLSDDCPFVRIIAIKGICSNMKYFWVTFQNGTAEQVIEKFITDLVVDGSYADVRKAVYQGLTQLLENSESHALLKCVLPSLKGFIHDENQTVRQAFILMLLKIKSLKTEIKYWQIVDIYDIATRLANDSPKNRELIVKLIFSSFFNDKVMNEETYNRLCKFVTVNPTASRYLAMYSKDVLKFENAIQIMYTILSSLRRRLLKIIEAIGDENKEPEKYERPEKKTKSSKNVLASVENISEVGKELSSERSTTSISPSNDSNSSDSVAELTPLIAHGLLDFVCMLWLIHGKTLNIEENTHQLEKLYTYAIKCIPLSLRYFKGTHAYFGALNLISIIPLSKLAPSTVVGSCLSILRQMNLETPSNEIHCITHALCMWNRGPDVLDLVTEWLNEAFRTENLNESHIVERPRNKRVKLPHIEPKPDLALRLLDVLLSSPADQQYVFLKNTADLYNLFNYLSRVKILIERRIERKKEINELLNDKFLVNSLMQYGNLIIMFNERKVANFEFWKNFVDYLEWCKSVLVQCDEHISNNDKLATDSIIIDLIQVPLIQALNLVALGKCEDEHLIVLSEFYLCLLNTEYGVHIIENSMHFVKQLILFSKIYHSKKRNVEIMKLWFPRLLDSILSVLTDKIHTKETFTRFVKVPSSLRKCLIYVYLLTIKLYPNLSHSSPSYRIMQSFCNKLINIVLFPIKECETLNVDQNVKNLPFVGNLLATVFVSQKELSSAFLYVLETIINRYTEQDGLLLLAAASLLYTFSFSGGKTQKSEILKVVKITYHKVLHITAEQADCLALVINHERTMGDHTIIDIENTNELAVKEIGKHILRTIAEQLGGSLS